MSADAFERTLRLLRHSPTEYARGYRAGAACARRGELVPRTIEALGSGDYRQGFDQARRDALAYVSDSAGREHGARP